MRVPKVLQEVTDSLADEIFDAFDDEDLGDLLDGKDAKKVSSAAEKAMRKALTEIFKKY